MHQPALSIVQVLRKLTLDVSKCPIRMPLRRPSGPPGPGGGGGCWHDSGTVGHGQQAVRVRNTLGAFLDEAERDIGSAYEATVWRKLENGTQKAYVGALYKLVRYSNINGFMAPREALKECLLQVAKDG